MKIIITFEIDVHVPINGAPPTLVDALVESRKRDIDKEIGNLLFDAYAGARELVQIFSLDDNAKLAMRAMKHGSQFRGRPRVTRRVEF